MMKKNVFDTHYKNEEVWRENLYCRKVNIEDYKGEIYPIWIVYKKDRHGIENQLCVLHSEEEVKQYKESLHVNITN